VNRKTSALVSISLIVIAGLVLPVSAFYFDFQYFETDKLVYEVGETIDMVAKLIADFSNDGWCYISFAVVTDLGPSFSDTYYITPSPVVRYFNSSYTILPEHTSPGVSGAQAFVLFTVEIYDTVSQSAGDNIEVTINRGHLTTLPLSSLSVEYGQNTTLPLKVASIHNDSIGYVNESVNLHIEDPNSQTVLDMNTTTTSEGLIYLNWNDSFGPIGVYNLTVTSDGNEDFLSFSDSFDVTVLPASSNLTIVSSPEFVYCQSPDASHIEQAEIIVGHTDLDSAPLDNSTVQWTASFGSGTLTNLGNGQYSDMIDFATSPGSYQVNFTAVNSQYRTAQTSIVIDVLRNSLFFSAIQPSWTVTRGNNVTIEFTIEPTIDWNQSLELQFTDETLQFSAVSSVPSNGSTSVTIPIWHNISVGHHVVNITPVSEYYEFMVLSQVNLTIIGTFEASLDIDTIFYGESLEFNLTIVDDNSQSVSWVDLSVFCDDISTPFAVTGSVETNMTQSILFPIWISPGLHNITFVFNNQYYLSTNTSITVKVWMRTNLTIVISSIPHDSIPYSQMDEGPQDSFIIRRTSSGSIIRPPPILFKDTTSTVPPTTRLTSPDN